MGTEHDSRRICMVFGSVLCSGRYALVVFDPFLVRGGLAAAFGIQVGLGRDVGSVGIVLYFSAW